MDKITNVLAEDALGDDDAVALSRRLQAGELSAGEATEAAIQRLQAAGALNALAATRFDEALEQAARPLPALNPSRPFAGVPALIKDNLDIAGLPTRHGSQALAERIAAGDAPLVAQCRASGLNLLGKTRLPEFGLTASTEFSSRPPTRNPWHGGHSCGGSSGGSAALVAAGAVPIAHANDGGGSIRIPAACCGLVGLKPSLGRLAMNPMNQSLPIKLVADGVVTRSVRDTAHFIAALEQQQPARGLPAVGLVEGPSNTRLRIGFYTRLPDGEAPHADCSEAVAQTARLCERLGHQVDEISSPQSSQSADDFLLYWAMLAAALAWAGRWSIARGFQAQRLEPLTWQLARHFRANAWRFPGALLRQRRAPRQLAGLHRDYDLILSPTLGQPPPPLGHLRPGIEFDLAMQRLRQFAAYTPADNVCGTPAISLPLARNADGLPIGVHFSAAMGQERRLLELAYALEAEAPWPQFAGTPQARLSDQDR